MVLFIWNDPITNPNAVVKVDPLVLCLNEANFSCYSSNLLNFVNRNAAQFSVLVSASEVISYKHDRSSHR